MVDNTGLGMMMSAIRRLIPEHVWGLVEANILSMGKKVADIEAAQKRTEEKLDRLLVHLSRDPVVFRQLESGGPSDLGSDDAEFGMSDHRSKEELNGTTGS